MMRVVRLVLLGLLAYIVSVVFLFPAAPLVERIKPQIQPVQLTGVTGKLFNGQVASVVYADDLLPLEFQNVGWKLAPGALLKGGAGANVSFQGYGGGGDGQVRKQWNGDLNVSDLTFNADSKELEVLLPGPVADFSGQIDGQIDTVQLVGQVLETFDGTINWNDAVIVTRLYGPEITANLGQFNIVISPENNAAHLVTLKSNGGDLNLDGTVNLSANGDYTTNLLLTPAANAPQPLIDTLKQRTRPDSGGGYRIQHSGNMNQGT